jgi:hypothetical protein
MIKLGKAKRRGCRTSDVEFGMLEVERVLVDVGFHRDDEVATASSLGGGGRSVVLAVDVLADGSICVDVVAVIRGWSGSASMEAAGWRVVASCCRKLSSRRHFSADCSSCSSGDPVGGAAVIGVLAVKSRTEMMLRPCVLVTTLLYTVGVTGDRCGIP